MGRRHRWYVHMSFCPTLRPRGFTLVETLIALLVLSIGLLGIAALYLEALQFGRSAQYRTQAVSIAADLAERIRANRVPVDAYTGSGAGARSSADLAEWNSLVAAQLPQGEGEVRFVDGTAVTPATYTIRVRWTEIGQANPVTYELRLEI
jgi:type IV pilus assembly protein PilV